MGRSQCRDCGAPIRWATTTNGARIPLMESSDPQGTYCYVGPDTVTQLFGQALQIEKEQGTNLFLPHMAVCPATRESEPVPDFVEEWIAQRSGRPRK